MKIVINKRYGGFGLSDKGHELLRERAPELYNEEGGKFYLKYDVPRHHPELVAVVEILGDEANSWAAKLEVVTIPDDVEYYIQEYDGMEWIAEVHKTWG